MPEIDLNKLNQYVNFLKTHLFFSDCEQPYDIASKKHTCVNKGDEIFLLRGYNGDIVGSFIYGEGTFSDEVYNILKPKPVEPPYSLPNGFVPVEVEEE